MPPLPGLYHFVVLFYKYAAPTALAVGHRLKREPHEILELFQSEIFLSRVWRISRLKFISQTALRIPTGFHPSAQGWTTQYSPTPPVLLYGDRPKSGLSGRTE